MQQQQQHVQQQQRIPLTLPSSALTRHRAHVHQRHRRRRRNTPKAVARRWLRALRPSILDWAPRYRWSWVRGDVFAGLVVGAMLIPQSMAYAFLAGMPAIYGLYSSIAGPLVYIFVGTSRHLSIGPASLIAIMTNIAVTSLHPSDAAEFVGLSTTITLVVGLLLMPLGALRLGFITNYLSKTALSAFITASGVITAISQVKAFLGIRFVSTRTNFMLKEVDILSHVGQTHGWTVLTSVCCMTALVALKWKRIPKWFPGPLVVMMLSILVSWAFHLEKHGIAVVGHIPSGLPPIASPHIASLHELLHLLPTAASIAFVSYVGNIALGAHFGRLHGYDVSASMEMFALGACNVVTAFTPSMPVTGSYTRTAVNDDVGCFTPLSGIAVSGIIILTLELLTGVMYYLPKCVLACIVILSVRSLIDYKEVMFLWSVDKIELCLFVLSALLTIVLGIEQGMLSAIVLSVALQLWRSSVVRAHVIGTRHRRHSHEDKQRHHHVVDDDVTDDVTDDLHHVNAVDECVVIDVHNVDVVDDDVVDRHHHHYQTESKGDVVYDEVEQQHDVHTVGEYTSGERVPDVLPFPWVSMDPKHMRLGILITQWKGDLYFGASVDFKEFYEGLVRQLGIRQTSTPSSSTSSHKQVHGGVVDDGDDDVDVDDDDDDVLVSDDVDQRSRLLGSQSYTYDNREHLNVHQRKVSQLKPFPHYEDDDDECDYDSHVYNVHSDGDDDDDDDNDDALVVVQLRAIGWNEKTQLRCIIIDCVSISQVDTSGLHAVIEVLHTLCDDYGLIVVFAGLSVEIYESFVRAGIVDLVGPDRFIHHLDNAVTAVVDVLQQQQQLVDTQGEDSVASITHYGSIQ